jgi:signal transduction histidine kinase
MNRPVGTTDAIATLTRFSRTLSTATDPAEMLQLLARASIEQLGASGAVVLQVGEEGIARVAAHAGISIPDDFSTNVDEIGPELGRRLIEAAGEHFEQAHTFPLVSDGDLFGALVVLFREGTLAEVNLHLAAGLVDLAASMLGKAYQYIGLNRAHTELKVAHETLTRTEKLRALGEMAAGISHDLRNILAPMSMQVDRLERAPQDVERVKQVAQSLRDEKP